MNDSVTGPGAGSRLGDTRLTASRRAAEIDALAAGEAVDLVVIGGGITGAGIALDAASRGLRTVLLEAHDLAFGTSRWSSKLAHGGLRYLATGDVGVARRSAVERETLLARTAPHLVRPLAQVVPVFRDSSPATAVLPGLGFVAGTLLGRIAGTPRALLRGATLRGPRSTAQMVPAVRREGLLFSHVNWDGQLVDDARLVTDVARTAAGFGARVLTRVRVESATGTHVEAVDELGGRRLSIDAGAVVNATGVWAAGLDHEIRLRPSRGTHIVVSAESMGSPTGALTVPVPGYTNRFCFCLPVQMGRVIIGLTDVDAPGGVPDVPEPTEEEIDFLLDVVGRALEVPLTRDDVLGAYAGLRPLIDSGSGETADLSREHSITVGADGLVTITGGKLTEYRLMAEQLVDRVVAGGRLGRVGPCRTSRIPLVGAPGSPFAPDCEPLGVGRLPASLVERHGDDSAEVVRTSLLERPLEPVAPGIDVTRAEFSYAVTHEGALDVSDILDRRTRIGFVAADREAALACAEEALAAVG